MTHSEATAKNLDTDTLFVVNFGYEMSEMFESEVEARDFFAAVDYDCDDHTEVELFSPAGHLLSKRLVCGTRRHWEDCEHSKP